MTDSVPLVLGSFSNRLKQKKGVLVKEKKKQRTMEMMVHEGFGTCMRLSAHSTNFKIIQFQAISAANHK